MIKITLILGDYIAQDLCFNSLKPLYHSRGTVLTIQKLSNIYK